MSIHPKAEIDPTAKLGRDVSVGPFAVILGGTEIGDGCVIGPHAVIHPYTTLGPGCRVHAGAVLGDLPQDLAFKDAVSRVVIGANCTIREGVTVHRGTKEGTETVVGDNCFLMALSHLAHNCRLGKNVILANGVMLAGYVEVGDRAFLSGYTGAHQFVRIGRLAMLAGGCIARKDVPPFCTAVGMEHGRVVGLNVVGMRRAGLSPAERAEVKKAFNLLYRSGLNVSQAAERMKGELTSAPAAEFREFVEASKRGVCGFKAGEGGDEEA